MHYYWPIVEVMSWTNLYKKHKKSKQQKAQVIKYKFIIDGNKSFRSRSMNKSKLGQ